MMQVSYNGRFLASKHPTGTHRSALSFLKALASREDAVQLELYGPRVEQSFDRLGDYPSIHRNLVRMGDRAGWHLWEQLCWPFKGGGLAINPLNTGPFLPFTPRQIIFAHDINLLRYPGNYSRTFWWWNRFASISAMKRARHLVCFSDYVKTDLVERLRIPQERITVIPQGPGLPLKTPEQPQINKQRFFLCVGGMQPHKNLKGCLEAWKISGLAIDGYRLRIVGKPQANYSPLGISDDLINQLGVDFTGYVSDEDLACLFRYASGFLYPSFDEGFGLPMVEAFYLGAPVITSNRSCLPEIAGDAAILVDPYDCGEIAKAMRALAGDEVLRSRLMAAGTARANRYSWDNAGECLVQLLKKLNSSVKTPPVLH
jgi:glycosyltransferase involved in cell wall biosynthesis